MKLPRVFGRKHDEPELSREPEREPQDDLKDKLTEALEYMKQQEAIRLQAEVDEWMH